MEVRKLPRLIQLSKPVIVKRPAPIEDLLSSILVYGKPNPVVIDENLSYERLDIILMYPDYFQEGSSRPTGVATKHYQLDHVIPRYLFRKNRSPNGVIKVTYREKGEHGIGRHMTFDEDNNWFGASGGFARRARHFLYHDIAYDIDMENCHPRLFQYLLSIAHLPRSCVNEYVDNRVSILDSLMTTYGINRDQAKNLPLRLSYGGSVQAWMKSIKTDTHPGVLWDGIQEEVGALALRLEKLDIWRDIPLASDKAEAAAEPEFDPDCEELQVHYVDQKAVRQVERSKLSYVMQHLEKRLLMSVLRVASERGVKPLALCYDGLLVDKHSLAEDAVPSFLKELEERVKTEFGGLVMPFSSKAMACPPMPPGFNPVWFNKIKTSFSPEFFMQLRSFNPLAEQIAALKADFTQTKLTHDSFARGKAKQAAKEEMARIKAEALELDTEANAKLYDRQLAYFEQFHGVCKDPIMFYHKRLDLLAPATFYNKTDFSNVLSSETDFLLKWFADSRRLAFARADFLPPPMTCPPDVMNTFRGLVIEAVAPVPTGVDFSPILDHISFLCNHDQPAVSYFTKYLAHMVQRPGENPRVAIVLHSRTQGVGKNILLELFCCTIMGSQYLFATSQLDQVTGRFSNVPNKFMVILDEIKYKSQREVDGIMKSFITTDVIRWEQKGLAVQDVNNVSRFFILSNESCPVKVEDTDRRYCIIECTATEPPSREYFDNLGKLLTDKVTMRAFYDYLMAIDLTTWDPRDIPMTDSKRDLIAMSQHPVHDFITGFVESSRAFPDPAVMQFKSDGSVVVSSTYLLDLYNKEVAKFGMKPISNNMFSVIMKRELQAAYGRYTFSSGQLYAVTFTPPVPMFSDCLLV